MTERNRIKQTVERARAFTAPVVSIYAGQDRRRDGDRDLLTHIKCTLDAADVDRDTRDAVMTAVESQTSTPAIAIFVERRTGQLAMTPLPNLMAVAHPQSGAGLVRVGEPFVAPLLDATVSGQTFVAMYIDHHQWRLFRISSLDAEELAPQPRAPSFAAAASLDHSAEGLGGLWIADRGGPGNAMMRASIDEAERRFYADAARALEHVLLAERMDHAVLAGPGDGPDRVAEQLPPDVRTNVCITRARVTHPDASPGHFQEALADALSELKHRREQDLIKRIRATGVTGLRDTLSAWQKGRLQTVLLPLSKSAELWQDPTTGYLAVSEASTVTAPSAEDSASADRVELGDVLSILATQHAVNLVFASSTSQAVIEEALGGIGGLLRG